MIVTSSRFNPRFASPYSITRYESDDEGKFVSICGVSVERIATSNQGFIYQVAQYRINDVVERYPSPFTTLFNTCRVAVIRFGWVKPQSA